MSNSADQCKVMGNACMKDQDFTTAVKHYGKGLELEPDNPILNCNMAQAYLNLKEYVEAEKFAKVAIEKQENYTKAYFRAAKAAFGRYNIYDAMLYIARGVQHCSEENLEDLFSMAKDLSQEFETALRAYREKTEPERRKARSSSGAGQANKQNHDSSSGNGSSKAGELDIVSSQTSKPEIPKQKDEQKKTSQTSKPEISKQKEEQKRTSQTSKPEIPKQKEEQKKTKIEIDLEMAFKEDERKERLLEEKEKMERESKEKEKERKERERKERERAKELERERERNERERKELLKKEQELVLKRQAEKKREEEISMLKAKASEDRIASLKIELRGIMKDGSFALIKGLNRKAVESLKKAMDIINNHPPPEILGFGDHMDLVVLQFAFCQALILSDEYVDIVRAIQILEKLEKEGQHIKLPAILLLLGRAYLRMNRFKNAQLPFERALSFLSRNTSSSRYSWPGTYEVIELTDRSHLTEALENDLQLSKCFHKPDAVCFYENCLDNSQHLIPSRNIFFSDPDFVGFVDISCQELCHIYFHTSCWKDYKEKMSEVEKLNEKDFLGRNCLTPDCTSKVSLNTLSVITKVTIVGPDGEEKSSCECAPPAPGPIASSNNETPKKKQRKKDIKMKRINNKRTRQDSKCHGDIQQQISSSQDNFKSTDFKDALSKLDTAREINFGYNSEAPDAFKVNSVPEIPQLGKNEEFVYSYFLEIFKRDGCMSVFKLQEHWEANKELLPVLEPALITHTDLVKFLVDTKGFAVVQDMISIASELPIVSTAMELKADLLPKVVNDWQPSPATVLEASKTLSFTSSNSNELGTGSDKKENKTEDTFPNENGSELEGVEEFVANNSCAPLNTVDNQSSEENSEIINPLQSYSSEHTIVQNETSETQCNLDPVLEASSPDKLSQMNVTISDGEDLNANKIKVFTSAEKPSSEEVKEDGSFSLTSTKCDSEVLKHNLQPSNQFENLKISADSAACFVTNEHVPSHENSKQVKITDGSMHQTEQSLNGIQEMPPKIQGNKKIAWKPRAKLLEWVTTTFPDESPTRLWEALTLVRSQNNYTLSGLTFDVIAERVRCMLLQTGDGDF